MVYFIIKHARATESFISQGINLIRQKRTFRLLLSRKKKICTMWKVVCAKNVLVPSS